MAEFFMGQIMMNGFGYAPRLFARCDGATMPVTQNAALFSLLGKAYGGDGVTTFQLPDLRGRTPVGGGYPSANPNWQPPLYPLASTGGVEQVALTADQNPAHTHALSATTANGSSTLLDGDMVLAGTETASPIYGPPSQLVPLGGGPTSVAGTGAPHDNMQPFQAINFTIALTGIFPSRN